ncbi:choice-of-anchor E domain-containing protein [Terrimonas alba]|uniref:choice-of-anchor E domain-containing protein n=1 Tax=Terrimonas alba TaxID=3349636 RepID=UPI0035F3BB94
MNRLYKKLFFKLLFLWIAFFVSHKGLAQCPDGYGAPTTSVAFDTSFAIPAGNTSMPVYLPKFDPSDGMVNCMRLCLTITGIVDSLSFENNQVAPHTYTASYSRTDMLTGPGLSTPIFNSDGKNYSFPLLGQDGVPGSGPDFGKVVNDTVLNAKSNCVTITNSGDLTQFYGHDSLLYNYTINAGVSISSGGNASIGIATSGQVNIRFEYCYCPAMVLPLNIRTFNVYKLTNQNVDLKWEADDDQSSYYYEVEVSRDGTNFLSIGTFNKNIETISPYKMTFTANNGETGTFYFRIKQVYANGYIRYSNIRQVVLESSAKTKFSIYPNPSKGIVGIKFDNKTKGIFKVLVYTTLGQMAVSRDLAVDFGSPYMELARLEPGVYWVRLTDKKSLETSVTQLLIK